MRIGIYLPTSEKHNLVFCVTEHSACSYEHAKAYNQCQIITALILKSYHKAKSRVGLKKTLIPMTKVCCIVVLRPR